MTETGIGYTDEWIRAETNSVRVVTTPGVARLVVVGGVLDLALAAAIGTIRSFGASAGAWHAEGLLPTQAFALLFAAPGVLAAIGLYTSRPALLAAAGAGCLPLQFVSFVAFPILIPAVLFMVGYARTTRRPTPLRDRVVPTMLVFLLAMVGALFALLTNLGTYDYETATGSESGDYVRPGRAALVIALTVVGIVAAAFTAARDTTMSTTDGLARKIAPTSTEHRPSS